MLNIAGGALATGYNLNRSLRFRASASAYLNRTPASAGNRKTWTWSAWVKRGTLGSNQVLFISKPSGGTDATFTSIGFTSTNTLLVSGLSVQWKNTTQVFRDPSAWYHIVITWDTTQATASNRVRVYVNGSQVTAFSTTFDPSLNFDGAINQADVHAFCRADGYSFGYLDGYLAEVNFIDGQALTPSSFGSTNALTGVWQPAPYTGTYGTNGFYLPFTDNSALTTSSNVGLGRDFSGNGNYWTTNNISITAGVTYDSMTDVPTLTNATTANYAVLNPLTTEVGAGAVPINGNLTVSNNSGRRSTIAVKTGKWYWEFVPVSGAGSGWPLSGLYVSGAGTYWPGYDGGSIGYFQNGNINFNGGTVLTVSSFTNGDIIGLAYDADTGKFYVAKNGTWQNSGNPAAGTGQVYTLPTNTERVAAAYSDTGIVGAINFGQRPFAFSPPTGFVALNTFNLPDSTLVKGNTVMDATLYTGNGSTQTITNAAGFQPDLVWYKGRSFAYNHGWFDSVRGATNYLASNLTDAETSLSGVTSFNSNGFTLGTSVNGNGITTTYVGWQWKGGGAAVSNTSGSITSQVSANTSAGFSVVTYTGTGANATVGHGLGVAPKLIIVKARSQAFNWNVYSASLSNQQFVRLNTADSVQASALIWNATTPTSSVFSLGAAAGVNGSGDTHVAYCWSEIDGFSKFGSYTGNGSADGPFVYTGFKPKFVLIKSSTSAFNWMLIDGARNTYNLSGSRLIPNLSDAEGNDNGLDILSNGFKLRSIDGSTNVSGGTMIFAAFAENPFRNSLAR